MPPRHWTGKQRIPESSGFIPQDVQAFDQLPSTLQKVCEQHGDDLPRLETALEGYLRDHPEEDQSRLRALILRVLFSRSRIQGVIKLDPSKP